MRSDRPAKLLATGGAALVAAVLVAALLGLGAQEDLGWKEIVVLLAGAVLLAAAAVVRSHGTSALWPAGIVLLLAAGTLYVQYLEVGTLYEGIDSNRLIEREQLGRHEATLDSEVGDPWRFRLLGEWLAAGALWLARTADAWRPELVGFLGLRLVENVAILGLAYVLLRRLGAVREHSLLGLALVGWGMTNANYHSALSYDTYLEVVVFVAAALLALAGRHAWLVPLTAVAVLNRESSLLIAVLPLALAGRAQLRTSAAALTAGVVAIVAVRLAVGPGELVHPDGEEPGLGLLWHNLSDGRTWANLFATLTVLPLLAAVAYPRWPRELRALALAIVPVWVGVHFVTALPAETRLMLVPYVLVVVPGALAALRRV